MNNRWGFFYFINKAKISFLFKKNAYSEIWVLLKSR